MNNIQRRYFTIVVKLQMVTDTSVNVEIDHGCSLVKGPQFNKTVTTTTSRDYFNCIPYHIYA